MILEGSLLSLMNAHGCLCPKIACILHMYNADIRCNHFTSGAWAAGDKAWTLAAS
jgi:hypothetical protein